MFALSVKLRKENEKLERNILDLKNHMNYLESNNDRLGIELGVDHHKLWLLIFLILLIPKDTISSM